MRFCLKLALLFPFLLGLGARADSSLSPCVSQIIRALQDPANDSSSLNWREVDLAKARFISNFRLKPKTLEERFAWFEVRSGMNLEKMKFQGRSNEIQLRNQIAPLLLQLRGDHYRDFGKFFNFNQRRAIESAIEQRFMNEVATHGVVRAFSDAGLLDSPGAKDRLLQGLRVDFKVLRGKVTEVMPISQELLNRGIAGGFQKIYPELRKKFGPAPYFDFYWQKMLKLVSLYSLYSVIPATQKAIQKAQTNLHQNDLQEQKRDQQLYEDAYRIDPETANRMAKEGKFGPVNIHSK